MNILFALLALAPQAHAASLQEDLIHQLETMRSVYAAEYAPADWKKKYIGYDLEAEFEKDVGLANFVRDQNQARALLKNFVYAMHDYHVSISFVATEAARLPLIVHSAGGKYFLVNIDRTKLPEDSFPFAVGDELVTFGGKSAADAVAEVKSQFTANIPGTDDAISELRLTSRKASGGMIVPQGPVTLGIRRQGETQVREIQLIWDYTPELIGPRNALSLMASSGQRSESSIFHPMMKASLAGLPEGETTQDIGARKTFTPALGAKIWESAEDSEFDAYIYKDAQGHLVGYLRIPGYITEDYGKAVKEFASVITRFQAVTDKMVIDQVNNPGGSVFYLYTLASMLSDKPLVNPRHRMAVTQADVSDALKTIDQLKNVKNEDDARKAIKESDQDGYPVSYELARFTLDYAKFLVSEWNAGRRVTSPYWIGGVDHINPAKVAYTKPILLLINHLDFSGGDFFPTIMQDNKRVTIMGSRTAGAGGYVNDVKIPNNLGVDAFRVTESIAERVDGNPIENLGVTPDIVYEMTPEDLQGGYAPYAKAIQAALDKM